MNKQSISGEFVEAFGVGLYRLYRKKHPINAETKVTSVQSNFDGDAYVVEYATLPKQKIVNIHDPLPRSNTTQSTRKKAKCEWWSVSREDVFFSLAYAPEINTVFYCDKVYPTYRRDD